MTSPLETRYRARNGHPHPLPDTPLPTALTRTDLHAHLAGCPRPLDMLRIGAEHHTLMPTDLLAEIGIRIEGTPHTPIHHLTPPQQRRLAKSLALPLDQQVPFNDLERVYRLRSPIAKNINAFIPLCHQIARDYQAMGVTCAELSFSGVVHHDRLALLTRALPHIEADTGVQLRFLASMGRNDDPEWDLDYIERLEQLAPCPFVVGVDFVGHETNSTRAIAPLIKTVATWASTARPGFVIRVHAGENPAHPENIQTAVEAVSGLGVHLRIGHGLYGADDATVKAMRDADAIVEFNLNSNFALSNIQHCRELPLRRYLDAGVGVVLGTDGYGIYATTLRDEIRAAWLGGLTAPDLDAIIATERHHLAVRAAQDAAVVTPIDQYVPPPDRPPVHFTPAAIATRNQRIQARKNTLKAHFDTLALPLLTPKALSEHLQGRLCVSFAGAWRKSWARLPPRWQQRIAETIAAILDGLDPASTAILHGGTRHGIDGVVGRLCAGRGFESVAVTVWDMSPDDIEGASATVACIVGDRLHDKAAGLYRLMKDHGGWCLFFGGGDIVGNEIQCAENLHLPLLLMDGPPGASTDSAELRPHRAFYTAHEALAAILGHTAHAGTRGALYYTGPNPAVDAVVLRHSPRTGRLEVLLVQRTDNAKADAGRWALPGGFVLSDAPKEHPWTPGAESTITALLRETIEESGLDLQPWRDRITHVGQFDGDARDPRNTAERWVQTDLFALLLPDEAASPSLMGGTDARDARWIPTDQLPWNLAFDHGLLIDAALRTLA